MVQVKQQSTPLQRKRVKKWGECTRKTRKGDVVMCRMKGSSAAGINPVDWVNLEHTPPSGCLGRNCKGRKQSS